MSAVREAFVLPVLFLTVVLLGGLRPGAEMVVVAPSLGALVAGVVLLALLVRSGTFAADTVIYSARPMLANLNGIIVLLTLFAASAQVIMLVIPESGVPSLIGWIVLTAMLAQALALGPDRGRMLRGLLVILGTAFLLKFVVLAALSTPSSGRLSRALQLLFDGMTLGVVAQRPAHGSEGYLAFAAILLYLAAVALLPAAPWRIVLERTSRSLMTGTDRTLTSVQGELEH
jgi:hypothetical protein